MAGGNVMPFFFNKDEKIKNQPHCVYPRKNKWLLLFAEKSRLHIC